MSQRAENAKRFMREGHNCAQAVVLAFRKELGLTEEAVLNLAGRCASGTCIICGAVLAIQIVMNGVEGKELIKEPFIYTADPHLLKTGSGQEFEKELGAVTCRQLRQKKYIDGEFVCIRCIGKAVQILEENLALRGEQGV